MDIRVIVLVLTLVGLVAGGMSLQDFLSNQPQFICPLGCSCAKETLQSGHRRLTLDCSGSQLTELPSRLPHFDSYRLYYDHNSIEHVAPAEYLHRVTVLDLSHNRLGSIQLEVLVALSESATEIHLHHNQLTALPPMVQQLEFHELYQMTLHGNPWECSCENRWKQDWIVNSGFIMQANALQCAQEEQVLAKFDFDSACQENVVYEFGDQVAVFAIVAAMFSFLVVCCIFVMLMMLRSKFRHAKALTDGSKIYHGASTRRMYDPTEVYNELTVPLSHKKIKRAIHVNLDEEGIPQVIVSPVTNI